MMSGPDNGLTKSVFRAFDKLATAPRQESVSAARRCRRCGCTDADCSGCIERTGEPCYWIEEDLCSACADSPRFIPPTETPAPGERFELREVEDLVGPAPIGHLVLVQWRDAAHHPGWRPYQEAHDAPISNCRSVGWLVAADDVRVVLSASREDQTGDVSDALVIPKSAVQRVCLFEAVDGQSDGGEILVTRLAFEQWFEHTDHPRGFSPSINLERRDDGQYLHPVVEHLWRAWNTSARQPQGPALRQWIPLKELSRGLVFITDARVLAVKKYSATALGTGVICTLMAGSAAPSEFNGKGPGEDILLDRNTLVIALEIESL